MASPSPGDALTEAHRLAQLGVSSEVVAAAARLWPLLDPTRLDSTFPVWAEAVLALVAEGKLRSAGLAAAYVEALRDVEGPGRTTVEALSALSREQAMTSLLVTGPVAVKVGIRAGKPLEQAVSASLVQSAGAMIRLVQQGSRDTITNAVATDEAAVGYARVTDGHPCAFCALLASRGAVYRSEATASFRAHGHCGCQPKPLYDASAPTHSPQAEKWYAQYKEASKGLSGEDAIRAFRRAYEGR